MFRNLWNADFSNYNIPNLSLLWALVAIYIGYIELNTPLVLNFSVLFELYVAENPKFEQWPLLLPLITAAFIVYIIAFVLVHERASYRKIGKQNLNSITLPHFLVNVIDLAVLVASVVLLEKLLSSVFGVTVNLASITEVQGENHPFQAIINFYNQQIPTYIELPYLLAIPVVLICADFPIYVTHYLTHHSRFLWYVVHRSHHSPEYLTPFGSGPVFAFGLLIAIPYFLATLAFSKLVYPEPLLVELLVIQLIYLITEKFNHSSAFYGFASKHRWLFKFFGNGPYHYQHHSAREGEEIVNVANFCFNFWDRLFGTFKEPELTKPPVGLTHQPKIILNPFRLYLSGLATILYELKHNKPKHWFKIIFGSVYYTPPETKEFLIVDYPGPNLYPLDSKQS